MRPSLFQRSGIRRAGTAAAIAVALAVSGALSAGAANASPTAAKAPAILHLHVTALGVAGTEGASQTHTVAFFTDPTGTRPASAYSARITWGDGSPADTGTTITGPFFGVFFVTGTHRYVEEGSYPVTVTVTQKTDPLNTDADTSTATVKDAPVDVTSVNLPPVSGQNLAMTATLTDANPFATKADFTAGGGSTVINWGDGMTSTGAVFGPLGGAFTIFGTHHYAGTGHFTVTVNVKDDGGSTASARATVLVYASGLGGNFAIGTNNDSAGDTALFWGNYWRKNNTVLFTSTPQNFKGWEDDPSLPPCGGTWTTSPYNSGPPPAAPLPAYIPVIVTSHFVMGIDQRIRGDVVKEVVVKTSPGYQPMPSSPGTGTVVATICG